MKVHKEDYSALIGLLEDVQSLPEVFYVLEGTSTEDRIIGKAVCEEIMQSLHINLKSRLDQYKKSELYEQSILITSISMFLAAWTTYITPDHEGEYVN